MSPRIFFTLTLLVTLSIFSTRLHAQGASKTNKSVMQTLVQELDNLVRLMILKDNDASTVAADALNAAAEETHRASFNIAKHFANERASNFLSHQVRSALQRTRDNLKKERFQLASKSLADVLHACHSCHTQTNVPSLRTQPLKDDQAKPLRFKSRLLQIEHADFAYATRRYDLGFSLDQKAIISGPEPEVRSRFKRAYRTALVLLSDKTQSSKIVDALERRLSGDDVELIDCLRKGIRESKKRRSIEVHIRQLIKKGLRKSPLPYDLCGFPYFAEASAMARRNLLAAKSRVDKSKALFLYALSESLLDEANWSPVIDQSFIESIELAPQLDEAEYALAILRERAFRSWSSVGFEGIPESTERVLMELELLILKYKEEQTSPLTP